MVRKITNGEYLRRVDNMTAAERQAYLGRVGDWLNDNGQALTRKVEVFEARLQNVLQVSVGWNDAECSGFESGAVLLSAMVGVADTWLPDQLYAISAKRAIKRMVSLLRAAGNAAGTSAGRPQDTGTAESAGEAGKTPSVPFVSSSAGAKRGGAGDAAGTVKNGGETASGGGGTAGHGDGAVPVRPRHFDQYAHLLPVKTQERIAKYGPLMREMDEAREKLRLLMNDETASASDREAWAKRVADIDKKVGAIKREADAEWDKLVKSGRVAMDDFGNARVISDGEAAGTVSGADGEAAGSVSGADGGTVGHTDDGGTVGHTDDGGTVGHTEGGKELTSEQKARRRELRKWLIDTRRGNGNAREKRVGQWYENFREYLTLEGDAAFEDAKIKLAMEHYGIDLAELRIKS